MDTRCVIKDNVKEAAKDYKYLLNRGYNYSGALDLITSRYLLTKEDRMLLYRCVHRDEDACEVISKVVSPDKVSGQTIVIDGYNVILTVTSAIENRCLYLCDDGIVRDLRSVHIKDFTTPSIKQAIKEIVNALRQIAPKAVIVFLDKNVSWSRKHAMVLESSLTSMNINVKIELVTKTDTCVIASQSITATSDFVILQKAKEIFDLGGHIVKTMFPQCLNTWVYTNLSPRCHEKQNYKGRINTNEWAPEGP